jgi:hypothetical protein
MTRIIYRTSAITVGIALITWTLLWALPHQEGDAAVNRHGLTAVEGIKVGHHTLSERPTGCTVIIVEDGAVAGVDVRGSAPTS